MEWLAKKLLKTMSKIIINWTALTIQRYALILNQDHRDHTTNQKFLLAL